MEFQVVIRKQRPMKSVQVGLDNAQEIADWCHGDVVMSTVRLLGADTKVPAVKLRRQSKGGKDYTTALVTFWVVEHPNEFKIYRNEQYQALFEVIAPSGSGEGVSLSDAAVDEIYHDSGAAVIVSTEELKKMNEKHRQVLHSQDGVLMESMEARFVYPYLERDDWAESMERRQRLGNIADAPSIEFHELDPKRNQRQYLTELTSDRVQPYRKYQNGDYVQVVNAESKYYGRRGTVMANSWIGPVMVHFEDDSIAFVTFGRQEIELVSDLELPPTTKAMLPYNPDEGKHAAKDSEPDPFAEPENSTPAGESLAFEVDHQVRVIDKDSDYYDQTGRVVVVGVEYAHTTDGVEVEFECDGSESEKIAFHPTSLSHTR